MSTEIEDKNALGRKNAKATLGSGAVSASHRTTFAPPVLSNSQPGFSVIAGKTIVLGVTGSIAAFKAAALARLLVKDGALVEVVLTERAKEFVGVATFAGISSRPASHSMFDPRSAGETHVSLTSRADLIVIAPATADVLSRLAHGRADDLLTATALCARSPLVVAPAMHPAMWSHPATQRNVDLLRRDGRVTFVGPEQGEVASGEQGEGRMSEPERIVAAIRRTLSRQDLLGRHIVVTAGPTVEDVDPVRFITNRSSGKMGYALAERAAQRGARVTLISGPVNLSPPDNVQLIQIRSAVEMQKALDLALGSDLANADALVMAAAVADYRVAEVATSKLKREDDRVTLNLVKNPDLLAEIGRKRKAVTPILVGFAVETTDDQALIERAREKLRRKCVDVVVANHAEQSLGRDDNRVWLVTNTEAELVATAPKVVVAEAVLDHLALRFSEAFAC
jgi:phosphopantothenoylcysteine decarboxylase/phosphopantothenate--cysteine ligase